MGSIVCIFCTQKSTTFPNGLPGSSTSTTSSSALALSVAAAAVTAAATPRGLLPPLLLLLLLLVTVIVWVPDDFDLDPPPLTDIFLFFRSRFFCTSISSRLLLKLSLDSIGNDS